MHFFKKTAYASLLLFFLALTQSLPGEENDIPKKLKSTIRMAKAGSSSSMMKLANYYYSQANNAFYTEDKIKALDQALNWLRGAAKKGNVKAMMKLGEALNYKCQLTSEGTQDNLDEAEKWYVKAYKKKRIDALLELSKLHLKRVDFTSDEKIIKKIHEKALKYLELAAKKGYDKAWIQLGDYYRNHQYSTQEEKNKYLDKALDAYLKGAETGLTTAMLGASGCFFEKGDIKDAYKWNLKAAKKGNKEALRSLGKWYEEGKHIKKNTKRALMCYQKAAKGPIPEKWTYEMTQSNKYPNIGALQDLAHCYLEGIGCKKDYRKARKYFACAANAHLSDNWYWLGYMNENALGGKKNNAYALECYEEGAKRGDMKGALNLARLCISGDGVNKDYKKALKYLNNKFLEKDPVAVAWKFNIAFYENKKDEAENLAKLALAEDMENTKEAIKMILKIQPQNKLALYRNGELHYKEGRPKEALKQFQDLQKMDPEDKLLKDYIQTIKKEFSKTKAQ